MKIPGSSLEFSILSSTGPENPASAIDRCLYYGVVRRGVSLENTGTWTLESISIQSEFFQTSSTLSILSQKLCERQRLEESFQNN